MYDDMPQLVGATFGNQPDFNAFPGVQQQRNPWGGETSPWANMGNASPTWGAQQQQNPWTHGQYQPSPPSWTVSPPWSAPAGGPTPNWPSSPSGPGNWGDSAEPMTAGFYGAQHNNSPRWEERVIRSHSQSIPKRRRSNSRGRSHSFSGGSPWHGASSLWSASGHDTFDRNNLARRPRDWRADYTPKLGIMGMIYGRGRSDVQEISDPVKRSLHHLIAYNQISPPLDYDLRADPMMPNTLTFRNLGRPHNNLDLAQMATNPAIDHLRIYHPRFPWYIDVRASHPNGITIYDILTQLYQQMYTPITGRHFWNEELGDSERNAITTAFQQRCAGVPTIIQNGVVRVDFLGIDSFKFVLVGLARGKNGMWEMKTRRAI